MIYDLRIINAFIEGKYWGYFKQNWQRESGFNKSINILSSIRVKIYKSIDIPVNSFRKKENIAKKKKKKKEASKKIKYSAKKILRFHGKINSREK